MYIVYILCHILFSSFNKQLLLITIITVDHCSILLVILILEMYSRFFNPLTRKLYLSTLSSHDCEHHTSQDSPTYVLA
jgi:hypothetical protein